MKKLALIVNDVRNSEYESLCDSDIDVFLLMFSKPNKKVSTDDNINRINLIDLTWSTAVDLISTIVEKYDEFALLNYRESSVKICEKLATALGLNVYESASFYLNKINIKASLNEKLETINHLSKKDLPVVIKPSNLYSSLFVSLIRSENDLIKYKKIVIPEYIKYINSKGVTDSEIVYEPYLFGSLHSIDGLIDHSGNIFTTPVVDVITGNDIGIGDFHHYLRKAPSSLNDNERKLSDDYIRNCLNRLPKCCMAFHAEFIYTSNGPKLIEIGPRPGGNRIKILKKVYGINFEQYYYNTLSGSLLSLKEMKVHLTNSQKNYAMITPFASNEQSFQGTNFHQIRHRLSSTVEVNCHIVKGDLIGPVHRGFQNYYSIEITNTDIHNFNADLSLITNLHPFYL